MKQTKFSCDVGPWFMRLAAVAFATTAFSLSIKTAQKCSFLKGTAVYYQEPKQTEAPTFAPTTLFPTMSPTNTLQPTATNPPTWSPTMTDFPTQAPVSTEAPTIVPRPKFPRQPPNILHEENFNLGIFQFFVDSIIAYNIRECISYRRNHFKDALGVGPPEAFAKLGSSLAVALGGVTALALFAVGLSGNRTTLYRDIMTLSLVLCAILQLMTMILFATDHCSEDYWKSFLEYSRDTNVADPSSWTLFGFDFQEEVVQVMVSCRYDTAAYYSMGAVAFYIAAAGLAYFQWAGTGTQVFRTNWTVDDDYDPTQQEEEEETQPMLPPTMEEVTKEMPAVQTVRSTPGAYTPTGDLALHDHTVEEVPAPVVMKRQEEEIHYSQPVAAQSMEELGEGMHRFEA